jgi:hypothetical protein
VSKPEVPPVIGLRQAVLWMALGLVPRDKRLEQLRGHPMSIQDPTVLERLPREQRSAIADARAELLAYLIEDRLRAFGRAVVFTMDAVFLSSLRQVSIWEIVKQPAETRPLVEIPPSFWHLDRVGWDEDWAGSDHGPTPGKIVAYIDVGLKTAVVQQLWPRTPTVLAGSRASAARGGRRPIYDEAQFYGLLVWEAHANGLPETQAELVGRMAELLAVAWGEDGVPGETWLKARASELFRLRETYEAARQRIEGPAA